MMRALAPSASAWCRRELQQSELSCAPRLTAVCLDAPLQAGVEPHLDGAVRLLRGGGLPPEPAGRHVRRRQHAPAGHEVPGARRARQLLLPERLPAALRRCHAPVEGG